MNGDLALGSILKFPAQPHQYRHGPRGYTEAARFKPWLRDDFLFRCVFCLTRERWSPDGADAFGVEHFVPRTSTPDRVLDYDNLVYTCCRCNAAKRDVVLAIDPRQAALSDHVEWQADGTFEGLTAEGRELVVVCQLNRASLLEFRRGLFEVLQTLSSLADEAKRTILRRYFGFPANLPRLSTLRPPAGNTRPDGVANSYFAQRARGSLPNYY